MLHTALWHAYNTGKGLKRYTHELERFPWLTPGGARMEMAKRLLTQIQYFGNREDALPEWKEAASIQDPVDLFRIWPSLPIVTKNDLRTRFHPTEMQQRFGIKGDISSTGGSTGEPTPYLHDEQMLKAGMAKTRYCHMQLGWRPGMPTICIWGSDRDIGKQKRLRGRISSFLTNFWIIDGYELTAKTVDAFAGLVRRLAPVSIYGFTSMLEYVAKEVLARGECFSGSVATAWNGGEMLFDSQIDLFQQAFGVPILNLYGGRELGALAYQPTRCAHLDVLRPHLFLEVVDEAGRPAAPGETGRLIWTSTVCRGTPFLRYDIGDVGCYEAADCDESGIHTIRELQGRSAGLIKTPNGKTINCIYWNHLFKEFSEVSHFQVALVNDREIHLRLVGAPFTPERELELRRALRCLLEQTPVTISWVDRIPLSPQGKLIQVVHEYHKTRRAA